MKKSARTKFILKTLNLSVFLSIGIACLCVFSFAESALAKDIADWVISFSPIVCCLIYAVIDICFRRLERRQLRQPDVDEKPFDPFEFEESNKTE